MIAVKRTISGINKGATSMVAMNGGRTGAGGGSVLPLAMSALTFVVGIGIGFALHKRPVPARAADAADEPPVAQAERREARGEAPVISAVRPNPGAGAEEAAHRRSEAEHKARVTVDNLTSRLLSDADASKQFGLEGQGQFMVPYLMGTMAGLRAADPALLHDMSEALAERTCSHPQSDLEVMMVSQMVMTAPELGRPTTFDCALRGRKTEDVALWAMLDAWRGTGQEMPRAIAEIQDSATDERTKRRLQNYEQSRQERLLAPSNPPVGATPPAVVMKDSPPPVAEQEVKSQQQ
jgi:hypothetical protein